LGGARFALRYRATIYVPIVIDMMTMTTIASYGELQSVSRSASI